MEHKQASRKGHCQMAEVMEDEWGEGPQSCGRGGGERGDWRGLLAVKAAAEGEEENDAAEGGRIAGGNTLAEWRYTMGRGGGGGGGGEPPRGNVDAMLLEAVVVVAKDVEDGEHWLVDEGEGRLQVIPLVGLVLGVSGGAEGGGRQSGEGRGGGRGEGQVVRVEMLI